MTRPRIEDGRNNLQIWRIAAYTLNEDSWTTDKVWSSSLGDVCGATLSFTVMEKRKRKKTCVLRNVTWTVLWNGQGVYTGFRWHRTGSSSGFSDSDGPLPLFEETLRPMRQPASVVSGCSVLRMRRD